MESEAVEYRAFVLDPGAAALAGTPIYRDMPTHADRLRALASALAASPGFREMNDAVLVVRTAEPARIALLGRFSVAEVCRIESLAGIVEVGLRRLRYVSYDGAERAAEILARRLVDRVGADTLGRCRFVALPRGGLFVLGMLAYLLDLSADQLLEEPGKADGEDHPLVVVDDCALSGLRFAETLERLDSSAVVFAHLYSHPQLREEIERRESRVVACVSADDLTDLRDQLPEEERRAWQARWRTRSDERAYWLGLPEHVCFPWNEPDTTVWNTATDSEEAPWRIVPQAFCLKNRPLAEEGQPFQEQPRPHGSVRLAGTTVYARLEDEVLAANLETGQAHVLPGVAGEIWTALLETGDPDLVVARLLTEYEVDPQSLRSDVEALLESVRRLGLVEGNDAAGHAG